MTFLAETYALPSNMSVPKPRRGKWFVEDGNTAQASRAAIDIDYRNIPPRPMATRAAAAWAYASAVWPAEVLTGTGT